MKFLLLVLALTVSASASPAGATNIKNDLLGALKVAGSSINDTLQYVLDATKTSSTGTPIQNIVNQGKSALISLFANSASAINSDKFDLPTAQQYINRMLDISIFGFNQIVVQIQDQRVVNEFLQKTVKTYAKLCEILQPLLQQTNKQALVNTWDTINKLRITTIDALEYVKAQTKTWPNGTNFSNETDTVKPKFVTLFDKVYAELFNNTLQPQNTQTYVTHYMQLNSEVEKSFNKGFSDTETAVIAHLGDGQYWYNVFTQMFEVRKVFDNANKNAYTMVFSLVAVNKN